MERSWVRKWVIGKKSCVSKTTVLTEKQCGKNHEGKVQGREAAQTHAQSNSRLKSKVTRVMHFSILSSSLSHSIPW